MNQFSILELSVLLTALHFIGDFPFQSDWMAREKGKSVEVLLYHCLTYTAPFGLFVVCRHTTLLAVAIIFVSHVIIDTCRARLKIIKTIWADQLWHLSVLAGLLMIGWV